MHSRCLFAFLIHFYSFSFYCLFCLHLFLFGCFVRYLKVPPTRRDSRRQLQSAPTDPQSVLPPSFQSGHHGPVVLPWSSFNCRGATGCTSSLYESSSLESLVRLLPRTATPSPIASAKTQPVNVQVRGGSISPAAERPAMQSWQLLTPQQLSSSPYQHPERHVSCLSIRVNARPLAWPLKQFHAPPSTRPRYPEPVVQWASSRPPLPSTRAHVVLECFKLF